MNYRQALDYIESLNQYGIVPGLDNIKRLCDKLGNPQDRLKFIHICGTNGKGSTLAFLSTIYTCAGYKTGRYISPVISDYRERFQINAKMITQKDFCHYLSIVKEVSEELYESGYPHPTPFEVETAIAFCYFADKGCDLVVLETGMGGAEDATNIIKNTICAVIASISMDHMKFLGNSLSAIASEKAGIIKKGCKVVSIKQKAEAEAEIMKKAQAEGALCYFADPACATQIKSSLQKQSFSYLSYKRMEISLAGTYQIANAVLALKVIDVIKDVFPVEENAVREGLFTAAWPGRFCVVKKKPLFILDGAHNEDAAYKLEDSVKTYLQEYSERGKLFMIMGVLKDKEYEKIVKIICPYAAHIITIAPPNNVRALPAYELAKCVLTVNPNVTAADSLEEAVEMLNMMCGKDGAVLAFGSLSYLGALMKLIK